MPFALTFLCLGFAFCSMQYFMLITRVIGELTGDLAFWSAISSGCFLCAMGLGILQAEKTDDEGLVRRVGIVEAILCLSGPLSLVLIYSLHLVYRIYLYDFGLLIELGERPPVYLFALVSQLPLVWIGLLSGLEVGLMNRLGLKHGLKRVQILLAIYHVGGLLATLSLTLLLAPHFEPIHLALTVGLLNTALTACWVLTMNLSRVVSLKRLIGIALFGLLTSIWMLKESGFIQLHRKNFYYNLYSWQMDGNGLITFHFPEGLLSFWNRASLLPDIERVRGFYQTIDFVEELKTDLATSEESEPSAWSMYMDGRFQIHSKTERAYHEAMAHAPHAIRQTGGGKILVVGGGDGLLVRELLRAGDQNDRKRPITSIDVIDIDHQILDLAQHHPKLKQLNQQAFADPRVHLTAADAFQTLRLSHQSYDSIYVDILFPFNIESSRLYSVEFFSLIARSLTLDGSMTLLSPVDYDERNKQQSSSPLPFISSTLFKAGFRQLILFSEKRHSFFISSLEQREIPATDVLKASASAGFIQDNTLWNRIIEIPLKDNPALVNSILKPRFVGLKDPFF